MAKIASCKTADIYLTTCLNPDSKSVRFGPKDQARCKFGVHDFEISESAKANEAYRSADRMLDVSTKDGTIKFDGDNIKNLQIFVSGNHIGKDIRIVPDRNLPANELVKITKELKNFGAKRVFIVTENLVQ